LGEAASRRPHLAFYQGDLGRAGTVCGDSLSLCEQIGDNLGLDGVFAVTARPCRATSWVPCLVVEHVDALPAVDLDDARQLGPAQPSELDLRGSSSRCHTAFFQSSGPCARMKMG
jgi:hypothetical protein